MEREPAGRAGQGPRPEPQRDSIRGRWRRLPRFWRLLWGLSPGGMLLVTSFSAVSGLLPLLTLAALARLVDGLAAVAAGTGAAQTAALWLAALLLANALQAAADLGGRRLGDDLQERLKARLNGRLLRRAYSLPLATFESPAFYDRLHGAQRGLDARLFGTMENLLPVPSHVVTAAALLLYVGSAHILFPVALVVGLLPAHFAGLRFARVLYELRLRQTGPERLLAYLDELMTGREAAAEVRLFGLRAHLVGRRRGLFRRLRDERLGLARAHLGAALWTALAEHLTYGLVVAGAVTLIALGRMSVGTLVAFLGAAERFRDAVGRLLWSARVVDGDLRYIGDLLDYLGDEAEPAGAHGAVGAAAAPRPGPTPTVRFESVSFSYPGSDRPVLEEVDFTLGAGEHIALVGKNGAGKSTLAKLLLGLYSPTRGRITADGVDLAELDPRWWRSHVAAVLQDYVRYELTVRENIGLGDVARLGDGAAVEAAADRAGAAELVAGLPAGYDTPLGRADDGRGRDLSVGQWQKLALARAHMRADASVLVLDEPTAALDARAEAELYRSFHEMSRGKSVLFISHRLVSARAADRILLLEAGRIIEEGSHADLLRRGGVYAHLYTTQASWYQ